MSPAEATGLWPRMAAKATAVRRPVRGPLRYRGMTMTTRSARGTRAPDPAKRAGQTEKISVSLDRSALQVLRRRAKRLYAGNVSAAIAGGARRIREEAGRERLVEWLGETGELRELTDGKREAIDAE